MFAAGWEPWRGVGLVSRGGGRGLCVGLRIRGQRRGGGRWEVRAVVNWARVLVCGSAIGWLVVRWDGG